MALALNVFKTISDTILDLDEEVYTAPVGYTGVVLLAQVTNIGTQTETINLKYRRTVSGINNDVEMLKDYPVPASDTLNLLTGKLVIESGNKLVLNASSSSNLKLVMSILETLN